MSGTLSKDTLCMLGLLFLLEDIQNNIYLTIPPTLRGITKLFDFKWEVIFGYLLGHIGALLNKHYYLYHRMMQCNCPAFSKDIGIQV